MEIFKLIQGCIEDLGGESFQKQDIKNVLTTCKIAIKTLQASNRTHLLSLSENEIKLKNIETQLKTNQKKLTSSLPSTQIVFELGPQLVANSSAEHR